MRPGLTQRRRQASAIPSIQTVRIPAPIGINSVSGAADMGAGDCLYLYNMVSGEYGLRARTGYREWVTELTGADANTTRSMLPFTGSLSNGSRNRLFAATSSGLWDCTSSTSSPSLSHTFTTTSNKAGWGTAHTVVAGSGGHYLFYADEENGLLRWDESAGAWAVPTITGVSASAIVFVTVWKNRLFMVEKDTAKAWYLAAGAVQGAATSLNFAQRFKAGGHLVGLWSWTYDGGGGIDDALVAVSSGGDVAIYQGTDPDNADLFGLKGVWQLGAVPAGRRLALETGGDLLLLSTTGALPISKLVVGGAAFSGQYATAKIANLYQQLMAAHRDKWGWAMYLHPGDNAVIVTVPKNGEEANSEQLAMSLATGGWSRYRDLPITSGCVWNGDFYFGTADAGDTEARVCRGFDYLDNVTLANPNSYTAVGWSFLSRFSNLGAPTQKRIELIRPVILSQQTLPAVQSVARYDYNISEPAAPSGTGTGGGSGSWDEHTWDSAVFGDEYTPARLLQGATGMGRDIAVAVRGKAASLTVLVGVDVMFNSGGLL